MVDPIVQSFLKKLIFSLVMLAGLIILIKRQKTTLAITLLLAIMLVSGFLLEKLGLYPFGGRHIMPYSIFLYSLISVPISWIYNIRIKWNIGKIIVVLFLSTFFVIFVFHQSCTNTLLKQVYKYSHSESYKICIQNIRITN